MKKFDFYYQTRMERFIRKSQSYLLYRKNLCQWYPEYLQIVEHEQDLEDDPDSEDEIPDDEDCDFANDHEDSEKEFVKALSNNPNADHLLDIFIIFFLRKVETLFLYRYIRMK